MKNQKNKKADTSIADPNSILVRPVDYEAICQNVLTQLIAEPQPGINLKHIASRHGIEVVGLHALVEGHGVLLENGGGYDHIGLNAPDVFRTDVYVKVPKGKLEFRKPLVTLTLTRETLSKYLGDPIPVLDFLNGGKDNRNLSWFLKTYGNYAEKGEASC